MKNVSLDSMLEDSTDEVRLKVREIVQRSDVTHLVKFQNQMLDSSSLGESSFVIIGPGCTFKNLDAVNGKWLKDLPSQRQYPVAFYAKDISEFDSIKIGLTD